MVMTAASQGAIVGAKINSELLYEELGLADGLEYQDAEREAIREAGASNTAGGPVGGTAAGVEAGRREHGGGMGCGKGQDADGAAEGAAESRGGGREPQVVSSQVGKLDGGAREQ